MRFVCAALCLVASLSIAPFAAFADGKRDLEDGIAFYENLDTDRALERLTSASKAGDLPPKERARAFLYLGMVHFENGGRESAEKAWRSAFDLDRNVEVPKGTSPKTIEAIETARSNAKAPADTPIEKPREQTKTTTPEIKKEPDPLPKVTTDTQQQQPKPEEKKPDLTGGNDASGNEPVVHDRGSSTWIWVTAIGAVIVGGAVVGLVVATSGSDCEGGGGCVSVSFR